MKLKKKKQLSYYFFYLFRGFNLGLYKKNYLLFRFRKKNNKKNINFLMVNLK